MFVQNAMAPALGKTNIPLAPFEGGILLARVTHTDAAA